MDTVSYLLGKKASGGGGGSASPAVIRVKNPEGLSTQPFVVENAKPGVYFFEGENIEMAEGPYLRWNNNDTEHDLWIWQKGILFLFDTTPLTQLYEQKMVGVYFNIQEGGIDSVTAMQWDGYVGLSFGNSSYHPLQTV